MKHGSNTDSNLYFICVSSVAHPWLIRGSSVAHPWLIRGSSVAHYLLTLNFGFRISSFH